MKLNLKHSYFGYNFAFWLESHPLKQILIRNSYEGKCRVSTRPIKITWECTWPKPKNSSSRYLNLIPLTYIDHKTNKMMLWLGW